MIQKPENTLTFNKNNIRALKKKFEKVSNNDIDIKKVLVKDLILCKSVCSKLIKYRNDNFDNFDNFDIIFINKYRNNTSSTKLRGKLQKFLKIASIDNLNSLTGKKKTLLNNILTMINKEVLIELIKNDQSKKRYSL